MESRRVFLGTAAAGLGGGLGGLVLPSRATHAQIRDGSLQGVHGSASHAAVLDEVRRQIISAVQSLRSGDPHPGEQVRRVALLGRIALAHGVASQFDARLRQLLREQGRQTLLLREPDPDAIAAQLKVFGIDAAPRLAGGPAERARGLDALMRHGATPVFEAGISGLLTLGETLDRRAGAAAVVRQDGDCGWLEQQLIETEWLIWWACCDPGMEWFCWWYIVIWTIYWNALCSSGCTCWW